MLAIGQWLFDPGSRGLLLGNVERRLSPKAAGVLRALAKTPRQVWSRDALLERVWPNVIVGEEVLTHAVAELRSALDDDFRAPTFVETVHKSGYRLICPTADVPMRAGPVVPGASDDTEEADEADLSAYVAHFEACAWFEAGGRASLEAAECGFASALRREPRFALAHVGMAKTLIHLALYHAPRPGNIERALKHCRTARQLEPGLAEPLAVEASIHAVSGNDGPARQLFRAAMRMKPDCNETYHLLGRACFSELDPKLAAPVLERAAMLRGDDYNSLVLAATSSEMVGDPARARANYVLALPRIDARLEAFPEEYRALSGKAHCLVQLGRIGEAEPLLRRVCDHPDPVRHSPACIFALAGEGRAALDVLESSVDQGWRHAAWMRRDPCLHSLRGTARFRRIARSIGAA